MKKFLSMIIFLAAGTWSATAQFYKIPASQLEFDSVTITQNAQDKLACDTGVIATHSYVDSSVAAGGGGGPFLLISDTAAMLSTYAELFEVALKLNLTDTAAMLANYAELAELALKVNISDTAAMLNNYAELAQLALKLNISDTAAMLSNYAELLELSLKLNISDTAAMLANYAELSQVGQTNTASNLGGGLANFSTKVGVDLQFNSFKAADFDLGSNLISLDFTNSQAASLLQNGFLSATDWNTFNSKQATISVTPPVTLTGASVGMVNVGTTVQVLHGNAAGNASFGPVVNADITNGTIDLAAKVTGLLPIANAGTNSSTVIGARNNLGSIDQYLNADTTTANNANITIPFSGSTFTMAANETWTFEVHIIGQCSGSSGVRFTVVYSAAPTASSISLTANNTGVSAFTSPAPTFATTPAQFTVVWTSATTELSAHIYGGVTNGASSSVVTIKAQPAGAGQTATLRRLCYLTARRLN